MYPTMSVYTQEPGLGCFQGDGEALRLLSERPSRSLEPARPGENQMGHRAGAPGSGPHIPVLPISSPTVAQARASLAQVGLGITFVPGRPGEWTPWQRSA